jgi:broad specificity phosphatase PhoE
MADGKPYLLAAIRHGESEGNYAHEQEKRGDGKELALLLACRHETNYRLTQYGRWQLEQTGLWIKEQQMRFDAYQCSDTVRGRESAAYLGLPGATWTPHSLLRERDVREYQALTEEQRRELRESLSGALLDSPYYYHPFGEAPADLIDQRVSPMLLRISDRGLGSVLWVCHGDVLRALKSRIWHLTKDEFKVMYTDDSEQGMVLNGVVHLYTRIDPSNPYNVLPDYGWFKSYCPWCPTHPSNQEWIPIKRLNFSNDALLASVENFEQLVDHAVPDPVNRWPSE